MKMAYIIAVVSLGALAGTDFALADSPLDIPQVSKKPITKGVDGSVPIQDSEVNLAPPMDYQQQVISDPNISNFARAQAAINASKDGSSGGNVAIINQDGTSNSSTVIQSGNNNYASHTQKGVDNDIYLDQQGNNNQSNELQTGKHSHKVIIQNGDKVETEKNSPEN